MNPGKSGKVVKIIPKGEVYERQHFGKKQVIFKNYTWLETIKQQYTELINSNLLKLSEENTLTVFNPNGPYMPMQKIGKNNPLASDIEKINQLCREWNNVIDEILNTGIVDKEELSVYKYRRINETLETTVKESGWKRELYGNVLQDAIHNLQELTASVKEYQRECGIQSFDMPDESLAEIKKKKAALFKKLEWHQATCRKPKYVPYEKMTVYQKAEVKCNDRCRTKERSKGVCGSVVG